MRNKRIESFNLEFYKLTNKLNVGSQHKKWIKVGQQDG